MSALYGGFRNLLATGAFDWRAADMAVMLVGDAYVPDFTADATLADVDGDARLSPLVDLENPTVTAAGVCKADNPVFTNLLTTDRIQGVLVLLKNGGDDETFQLLLLHTTGQGFGTVAQSEDVAIIWDSALGVFAP